MSDGLERNYENLANAVVLTAAKDYRAALKKLKCGRKNNAALDMKEECEWFFTSTYFNVFTSLDGVALMNQIKEDEGYDS